MTQAEGHHLEALREPCQWGKAWGKVSQVWHQRAQLLELHVLFFKGQRACESGGCG